MSRSRAIRRWRTASRPGTGSTSADATRALVVALALLLAGCTASPATPGDADGDGLTDVKETTPREITIHAKEGIATRAVTSDPHLVDTDGDGRSDLQEVDDGTDPRDVDTDADGLLDGKTLTVAPESASALAWRARGILERPRGTFWGELDSCASGLLGNAWSSDRPLPDKLGDGDELRGWTITVRGVDRRVTSDPCTADGDKDGLTDDEERVLGTDPRALDTDGDGARDGADVDPLANVGLAFTHLTLTSNASAPRITLQVGALTRTAHLDASTPELDLDASDESASRTADEVPLILTLVDVDDAPVRAFPDGRNGVILTFDLATRATGHETYAGPDGSLSFDWAITRG